MRFSKLICSAVLVFVAGCGGNYGTSDGSRAHRSAKINCSELRTVGMAVVESFVEAPRVEKDSCWDDGGRAVYEAFVKTEGVSGRPSHWKFTFKTLNARSGIYELCQDGRIGTWECDLM